MIPGRPLKRLRKKKSRMAINKRNKRVLSLRVFLITLMHLKAKAKIV